MPIDPQFLESVKAHSDCPTPGTADRRGRRVGKMVRFYYPNRETLRWVPIGSLCLDCGLVEIPEGVTRKGKGGTQ